MADDKHLRDLYAGRAPGAGKAVLAVPRSVSRPRAKARTLPPSKSLGAKLAQFGRIAASTPAGFYSAATEGVPAVYNYFKDSTPGEVMSDVGSGLSSFGNYVVSDPGAAIADILPFVGGAKAVGEMVDAADQARAAGQTDAADMLETYTGPVALAGLIPEAGYVAGKTLRRGATSLAARAPKFDVVDDGPFLRVARKGVEPQIVPAMRDAPSIADMRVIMADPKNNPALRMANDLSVQRRGVPLDERLPVASFERQSGIARAQRAASEGSPEYKSAVFEAYGDQMPELVEATGAQNYDQLMEAAYRAFGDEANQQFENIPLRTSFNFGEGEYPTPSGMFRDVLGEGNLNVFRGGDRHPFLSNADPETGLTENEKFRAAHDFIGHVARGATFRPGGEEIAYATHAQTMSPLAQLALLSETRGQNSLVNFSPLNLALLSKAGPIKARIKELETLDDMRGRRGASGAEIADLNRQLRELGQETVYAPNVPGLLPPEYLDPLTPGGIPDWLRPAIKPLAGTAPERAVHLSRAPDLVMTDPAFYGTGHRGRDWAVRGRKGSPSQKTSFYLGDTGTVRPEKVVADISPYAYETQVSNLYDIAQDPEGLVALARALSPGGAIPDFMRTAREYGYSGIREPEFLPGQAAADVFDPVAGLRPITRSGVGFAQGGLAVRKAA